VVAGTEYVHMSEPVKLSIEALDAKLSHFGLTCRHLFIALGIGRWEGAWALSAVITTDLHIY
jgi:hypothetical protein